LIETRLELKKFENLDFKDFIIKNGFKDGDFMYLDPPYFN